MFGERLAILRKRAGLSQAELAELVHISPSAIGMYEQGRREPSLKVLSTLIIALNADANVLLGVKPFVL